MTLIPVSRTSRRRSVDRPTGHAFRSGLVVNRGADDIEQSTERLDADRHRYRPTGGDHLVASAETIGRVHGDGAHHVVPDGAGNLEDDRLALLRVDLERLEQLRLLTRWKGDVHYRADDLAHVPLSRLLLCVGHGSPL